MLLENDALDALAAHSLTNLRRQSSLPRADPLASAAALAAANVLEPVSPPSPQPNAPDTALADAAASQSVEEGAAPLSLPHVRARHASKNWRADADASAPAPVVLCCVGGRWVGDAGSQ